MNNVSPLNIPLASVELQRIVLESRMLVLRDEVKLRVANGANCEGTFDKAIEGFATLKTLGNVALLGAGDLWRLRRNDLLESLLDLLDVTKRGQPLRAEMVRQGFSWLSNFDYGQLRNQLLTYYWIRRWNPLKVRDPLSMAYERMFTDEELDDFAREQMHLINLTLADKIQPGGVLGFPLVDPETEDQWKFGTRLLRYPTQESDVQLDPEVIES